jgi:hypothetical protein
MLGRRSWVRLQGRTNAALLLAAREMGADFDAPADTKGFAAVRGRAQGCVFEVRVVGHRSDRHRLAVTLRHFSRQATLELDGPGLVPPDLDPARIRDAGERACYAFATSP